MTHLAVHNLSHRGPEPNDWFPACQALLGADTLSARVERVDCPACIEILDVEIMEAASTP